MVVVLLEFFRGSNDMPFGVDMNGVSSIVRLVGVGQESGFDGLESSFSDMRYLNVRELFFFLVFEFIHQIVDDVGTYMGDIFGHSAMGNLLTTQERSFHPLS